MSSPTETLYRLPTYSRSLRQSVLLRTLLFLLLDTLLVLCLAGQGLALRLGGPAALGKPMIVRASYPDLLLLGIAAAFVLALGFLAAARQVAWTVLLAPLPAVLFAASRAPLYPPFALLRWMRLLRPHPEAAQLLATAQQHLLLGFGICTLLTLVSASLTLGRHRRTGDTHGSSHWATAEEIAATGLLSTDPGIIVGAVEVGGRRRYLRDSSDRHALLFAPSGTGKSTCLIIPTLLEWPDSVLALDIKGELWHLTAGYRKEKMESRCFRFDPSCADGTAARYNPLLCISRTLEADKHAQALADVLVDPDGSGKARDFWQDSAHTLLTATILHVLFAERDKSLAGCVHFLTSPRRSFQETLKLMRATRHDPDLTLGWLDPATGKPTPIHPTVASVASNLLHLDYRTSSGILATALSHLDLFRDPIVAANTSTSDFVAEDLVDPEHPASLYLTIPPAELVRLRALIRIVLNQMALRLTSRLDHEPEAQRRRLLLLMDEFTALGRIDWLHRAIAYLRGYGLRGYISIQSLSQLFEVYGEHQSITSNCRTQVAFGANDHITAKLLSEMTGTFTVSHERTSVSGGGLGGGRTTHAQTELGRPLLTPDEIRRLPPDQAIIFVQGHPPIRGLRVPYFTDPVLTARAALPPPATSDRIGHDWSHWTGWRALPPDQPLSPDRPILGSLRAGDSDELYQDAF